MSTCIPAERLAAFTEGRLPRHEIAGIVEHLDTCGACMHVVQAAAHDAREYAASSSIAWPKIVAVAAIVAAIAVALPFVRNAFRPQETKDIARLVALAPRSARTVEPRLAGGFAWAPYRGPLRANNTPEPRRL